RIDYFDDIAVTCMDMAMPVVIIPAASVGKTGYESPVELDSDTELLRRIESIRLQAGKAMGLGDVRSMVIPKPVLISPAQHGGTINARYFMPHSCHKALAITGAIAIASSSVIDGTVTRSLTTDHGYGNITIEHPGGCLDIHLKNDGDTPDSIRAAVIRTARKIFSGDVYLPE
ncbi:PrpF domain-containing protein, partial [Salmonella enterica subsp. enterica serovar Corvallis]